MDHFESLKWPNFEIFKGLFYNFPPLLKHREIDYFMPTVLLFWRLFLVFLYPPPPFEFFLISVCCTCIYRHLVISGRRVGWGGVWGGVWGRGGISIHNSEIHLWKLGGGPQWCLKFTTSLQISNITSGKEIVKSTLFCKVCYVLYTYIKIY